MEVPTYEKMAKDIAEIALDEIFYDGKTIRELMKIVVEADYICKWIPVSKKLPEDGQSVLFCDNNNDIMVGYHVKGRPDTHFSQDGTYEDMKNVRAWMPLPEPYKAESEDK